MVHLVLSMRCIAAVLSQCEKSFFQSGAADVQPREPGIEHKEVAQNRLSFGRVDFERIAISTDLNYARQSAHGFNVKRADASDPPTGGAGFDLIGSSLRNNLAVIDYDHPVGQSVGFFEIMRGE